MKIGFTGTQQGMTNRQYEKVIELLAEPIFYKEAHHGDCIGSDQEFHNIIRKYSPDTLIHGHPPIKTYKRAFCQFDVLYQAEDYLPRNHSIVDRTDKLIATPKDFVEELRSGTWATIRYAKKMCKPILIVYPDGSIEEHR
jgi:hypothetical protein